MKKTKVVLKLLNELKPEVSINHLQIMDLIRGKKDIMFRELAFHTGVSTAAITGAIDRLCKIGLLERIERGSVHGMDRRSGGAALTKDALDMLAKVDEVLASPVPED